MIRSSLVCVYIVRQSKRIHVYHIISQSDSVCIPIRYPAAKLRILHAKHPLVRRPSETGSRKTNPSAERLFISDNMSGDESQMKVSRTVLHINQIVKYELMAIQLENVTLFIVFTVFYLLLALFSSAANIFIIVISVKRKLLKLPDNIFIVNQAVCDLILILIPAIHLTQFYSDLATSKSLNQLSAPIYVSLPTKVFGYVSIWSLALMAVRRVRKVTRFQMPRNSKIKWKHVWAVVAIVVIWLLNGLMLLKVFAKSDATFLYDDPCCLRYSVASDTKSLPDLISVTIGASIPLIVVMAAYGRLFFFLWHRSHESTFKNDAFERSMKQRIKTAKAILVLILLLIVCWLPFLLVNTYCGATALSGLDPNVIPDSIWWLLPVLSAIYPILNPFFLIRCSSVFNKEFCSLIKVLKCRFCCTRCQQDPEQVTQVTGSTRVGTSDT